MTICVPLPSTRRSPLFSVVGTTYRRVIPYPVKLPVLPECCQNAKLEMGLECWKAQISYEILSRRGGRAVEGAALEKRYTSGYRGFESHPLRHL